MEKEKQPDWKYEETQDEQDAVNFRPVPKSLKLKNGPKLFLLYGIIMGISLIAALISEFGADKLTWSKEEWWPYVSYAVMVVPILIIFFDSVLISFPTGDALDKTLAKTLEACGRLKAVKITCLGMTICIIMCCIDYFNKFGFNELSLSTAIGCIILAWFTTGIIRFIRFC